MGSTVQQRPPGARFSPASSLRATLGKQASHQALFSSDAAALAQPTRFTRLSHGGRSPQVCWNPGFMLRYISYFLQEDSMAALAFLALSSAMLLTPAPLWRMAPVAWPLFMVPPVLLSVITVMAPHPW